MTTIPINRSTNRRSHRVRVELVLLIWLSPLVIGCQGCREETPEGEVSQKEVTAKDLGAFPGGSTTDQEFVKPGHWTTISQTWQANADDYRGTFEAFVTPLGGGGLGGGGSGGAEKNDSVTARAIRPAVLPKGQSKKLEIRTLIPAGDSSATTSRQDINTRFIANNLNLPIDGSNRGFMSMRPHEYFFVVLTGRPEQFSAIQVHDWIRPPQAELGVSGETFYRLMFPRGDGSLPVPDTFFEWTSTAYVLWDDLRPEQLTFDQRQALRDWLQWGGQMIVNGPACAQALAGSEFADLLPLTQVRSVGLEAQPLVDLVEHWSVPTDPTRGTVVGLLNNGAERVSVDGVLAADARAIEGTDDLILERSLGRGRVCFSRFDLTSGWMAKWNSSQSFFNGVLLRRPPRQYKAINGALELRHFGEGLVGRERDARLNTRVRIFSRDGMLGGDGGAATVSSSAATPQQSWQDMSTPYTPGRSVAGWSDDSELASLASTLLREQAGITIPSSGFVAKALLIYLIILIPLNYLVFALLGKLEWAWVAVPLIGLGGAAWIARSAQLDIGFARSRTEINLLEIQPSYQRGHLTRYLALYNSLSTRYDFNFSIREAVALPVGTQSQGAIDCQFSQAFGEGVSLSGIQIPSNQTSAIHAEQLLELGGSLSWSLDATSDLTTGQLVNETKFTLYDGMLVMRGMDGLLRHDFMGLVEAGGSYKFRLQAGPGEYLEALPLAVERMLGPLSAGGDLLPGQARLVGRIEEQPAGLEIAPAVSQSQSQTVCVAHLAHAGLPVPQADLNLRTDIKEAELDDFELLDVPLGEFE